MQPSARVYLILAVLLVGLPPGILAAQQLQVGRIDRIVEILGPRRERLIQQPTSKVQIQRGGREAWTDAAPHDRLLSNELVRVERNVDARLDVALPAHRGRLVFLPELFRRDGARVFPPAVVGEQLREGIYALQTADGGTDLGVQLRQGALIVDWVHGRLVVEAAGTRTVITGTRVALSIAPDGSQGLLHLQQGSVQFPDWPEIRPSPGQTFHLQRGLAPRLWEPAAFDHSAVDEAIHYHNTQVWPRPTPFYRQPIVLLSTAVVVGAVAVAAIAGRDDDDSRGGTVIVRIPF